MPSSRIDKISQIEGTNIPAPVPDPEHEYIVADGLWEKLRRFASRVPFSTDVLAAYYCTRDPVTPARVKAVLITAIAYFVLPIDAIPDMIPGLGFSDDATVIATVIAMMRNHITPTHRQKAADVLSTLTLRKQPLDRDEGPDQE